MELDYITVTKIFDVMTIPISGGITRQIHDRYAYGLTFCSTPTGRIEYEFKSQRYISDHNHAVLLPMGQTYILHGISTGEFPLINFYCNRQLNDSNFAVFDLNTPSYYIQTYDQIRQLCRSAEPFCHARAMSLMYELISQLMIKPADIENTCLSSAGVYIDKYLFDPGLNMESVAKHAGISAGYLRKIFKEKYSVSPKRYILNARILHAKELLIRGDASSIFEVAEKSGFTNIYHFDRAFKESTGCSPSEYIQRFSHRI